MESQRVKTQLKRLSTDKYLSNPPVVIIIVLHELNFSQKVSNFNLILKFFFKENKCTAFRINK